MMAKLHTKRNSFNKKYFRLTPSTKRHKNTSFAILAEPGGSRSGSRSPSPSGRVSPFRGRGFNPAGSRHVSPAPSPPPPDKKHSPRRQSKIPKRQGSAGLFGEKIDFQTSPNKRKLISQKSQSLTNITQKVSKKPPPSPRRHPGKAPAFQPLSPIVGSSPEPSQSQSSPKYPKCRSQPQSRFSSPARPEKNASRSRAGSKPVSRNCSRETSPSKVTSPSRIPNYRNVQAKVNSFNKPNKPKVPPKPQVLTETTDDSDGVNTGTLRKRRMQRRNSHKTNKTSGPGSKSDGSTSENNKSKFLGQLVLYLFRVKLGSL